MQAISKENRTNLYIYTRMSSAEKTSGLSSPRVELPAEGLQALVSAMTDAVRRVFFEDWLEHFSDAEGDAWRAFAFTLPEALAWRSVGGPAVAAEWQRHGFDPEAALAWKRFFPEPSAAAAMRERFSNPEQAFLSLFADVERVGVANAFSLSMIEPPATVRVEGLTTAQARALLRRGEFISAVGHAATAEVLSTLLEVQVPMNRVSVSLRKGDILVVFQLLSRLEEGKILTVEEMQALQHKFLLVRVD